MVSHVVASHANLVWTKAQRHAELDTLYAVELSLAQERRRQAAGLSGGAPTTPTSALTRFQSSQNLFPADGKDLQAPNNKRPSDQRREPAKGRGKSS